MSDVNFVQNLSLDSKLNAAKNLVLFAQLPLFKNASKSEISDALVFAVEMQAIRLDLVHDELDLTSMMVDLVSAIDESASGHIKGWSAMSHLLPYRDRCFSQANAGVEHIECSYEYTALSTITDEVLSKAAVDLTVFNEFTFFAERDISSKTGLTYALLLLAIDLRLLNTEDNLFNTNTITQSIEDGGAANISEAIMSDCVYPLIGYMDISFESLNNHSWQEIASWQQILQDLEFIKHDGADHGDDTEPALITVKDLSEEALLKTAKDLIQFFNVSYFEERDVSSQKGLLFGFEMAAVHLGLYHDGLYENDEYTVADMLEELSQAVEACAIKNNVHGWQTVAKFWPYRP